MKTRLKWSSLLIMFCIFSLAMSVQAELLPVANSGFQLPVRAGDGNANDEDAYDVANGNDPPSNWSFINTANNNYGQARPDPDSQFTRDVTGGETSPFTAGGFDGDLILFANMNSVGASLTADSDVVGSLSAGTYTLTVAVGGRNTGSWNDLKYTISLVGAVSGVLGTPAEVTIDPGNAAGDSMTSAWTTNDYNVVDVSYVLNVPGDGGIVGEDFFIRIYAENPGTKGGVAGTSFTQAAIDNVRLDGPGTKAQSPSPENGATLVPVDTDVSWIAPADPNDEIVTYDVYFGTTVPDANCDGNPQVVSSQLGTSYDPGTLAYDTDYYWRVDVIDPNGGGAPIVVKGDCWSFTTAPQTPVITTGLEAQTVTLGDDAVLTISHTNGETFTWYKDGVEVTTGKTSDATTATLTISGFAVADEGNYSVVASNGAGSDASGPVQVIGRRLIGMWTFDGQNLDDTVDTVVAGAPTHDGHVIASADSGPVYQVGVGVDGGDVYDFAGDPNNNAIEIADPNYFNFYTRGFSFSAWVYQQDDTAGNKAIAAKQEECCGASAGWALWIAGNEQARITIRGGIGDSGNGAQENVGIGEWHMLTATFDPAVNRRFYFDGHLTDQDGGGAVVSNTGPLVFGAEDSDTTGDGISEVDYGGLLDQTKIWSYALSPEEVALEYVNFTPADDVVCVDGSQTEGFLPDLLTPFDYNSDCVVNVVDFAIFAQNYLINCNVPNLLNCGE